MTANNDQIDQEPGQTETGGGSETVERRRADTTPTSPEVAATVEVTTDELERALAATPQQQPEPITQKPQEAPVAIDALLHGLITNFIPGRKLDPRMDLERAARTIMQKLQQKDPVAYEALITDVMDRFCKGEGQSITDTHERGLLVHMVLWCMRGKLTINRHTPPSHIMSLIPANQVRRLSRKFTVYHRGTDTVLMAEQAVKEYRYENADVVRFLRCYDALRTYHAPFLQYLEEHDPRTRHFLSFAEMLLIHSPALLPLSNEERAEAEDKSKTSFNLTSVRKNFWDKMNEAYDQEFPHGEFNSGLEGTDLQSKKRKLAFLHSAYYQASLSSEQRLAYLTANQKMLEQSEKAWQAAKVDWQAAKERAEEHGDQKAYDEAKAQLVTVNYWLPKVTKLLQQNQPQIQPEQEWLAMSTYKARTLWLARESLDPKYKKALRWSRWRNPLLSTGRGHSPYALPTNEHPLPLSTDVEVQDLTQPLQNIEEAQPWEITERLQHLLNEALAVIPGQNGTKTRRGQATELSSQTDEPAIAALRRPLVEALCREKLAALLAENDSEVIVNTLVFFNKFLGSDVLLKFSGEHLDGLRVHIATSIVDDIDAKGSFHEGHMIVCRMLGATLDPAPAHQQNFYRTMLNQLTGRKEPKQEQQHDPLQLGRVLQAKLAEVDPDNTMPLDQLGEAVVHSGTEEIVQLFCHPEWWTIDKALLPKLQCIVLAFMQHTIAGLNGYRDVAPAQVARDVALYNAKDPRLTLMLRCFAVLQRTALPAELIQEPELARMWGVVNLIVHPPQEEQTEAQQEQPALATLVGLLEQNPVDVNAVHAELAVLSQKPVASIIQEVNALPMQPEEANLPLRTYLAIVLIPMIQPRSGPEWNNEIFSAVRWITVTKNTDTDADDQQACYGKLIALAQGANALLMEQPDTPASQNMASLTHAPIIDAPTDEVVLDGDPPSQEDATGEFPPTAPTEDGQPEPEAGVEAESEQIERPENSWYLGQVGAPDEDGTVTFAYVLRDPDTNRFIIDTHTATTDPADANLKRKAQQRSIREAAEAFGRFTQGKKEVDGVEWEIIGTNDDRSELTLVRQTGPETVEILEWKQPATQTPEPVPTPESIQDTAPEGPRNVVLGRWGGPRPKKYAHTKLPLFVGASKGEDDTGYSLKIYQPNNEEDVPLWERSAEEDADLHELGLKHAYGQWYVLKEDPETKETTLVSQQDDGSIVTDVLGKKKQEKKPEQKPAPEAAETARPRFLVLGRTKKQPSDKEVTYVIAVQDPGTKAFSLKSRTLSADDQEGVEKYDNLATSASAVSLDRLGLKRADLKDTEENPWYILRVNDQGTQLVRRAAHGTIETRLLGGKKQEKKVSKKPAAPRETLKQPVKGNDRWVVLGVSPEKAPKGHARYVVRVTKEQGGTDIIEVDVGENDRYAYLYAVQAQSPNLTKMAMLQKFPARKVGGQWWCVVHRDKAAGKEVIMRLNRNCTVTMTTIPWTAAALHTDIPHDAAEKRGEEIEHTSEFDRTRMCVFGRMANEDAGCTTYLVGEPGEEANTFKNFQLLNIDNDHEDARMQRASLNNAPFYDLTQSRLPQVRIGAGTVPWYVVPDETNTEETRTLIRFIPGLGFEIRRNVPQYRPEQQEPLPPEDDEEQNDD